MELMDLRPIKVQAVHPPKHEDVVAQLASRMRKDGWVGRPLLVEEEEEMFPFPQYFAWTGSHRIAAAKEAKLAAIPCRVIKATEARTAFTRAGYEHYRVDHRLCWRDTLYRQEGRSDEARLRALRKAGLIEAAEMMEAEINAPDGMT